MEDLLKVAELILLQVDHNRECGKADKFTKDEIVTILKRRVLKIKPVALDVDKNEIFKFGYKAAIDNLQTCYRDFFD